MASYHLAVKTVSRSTGRSAPAAAAYRAGAEIADERTGIVHDYTRKQGVEHSAIVLPSGAPEWAADRTALWNAAEQAETRKNSTVAREFEIALPTELNAGQRRELAMSFANEISTRHRVAVDVAIHAPHRDGDDRNHHAHLLVTTRQLGPDGLGAKTRELDQKQSGEVERWRSRWAEMQNMALERAGSLERVDHRSYERQGKDVEPELKQGPAVTAMERRAERQAEKDGKPYSPVTEVGLHNVEVRERRGLRQMLDQANAWLRDHGVDLGQMKKSALERIQSATQQIREATEKLKSTSNDNLTQKPKAADRVKDRFRNLPKQDQARHRDRGNDRDKDRDGPER